MASKCGGSVAFFYIMKEIKRPAQSTNSSFHHIPREGNEEMTALQNGEHREQILIVNGLDK